MAKRQMENADVQAFDDLSEDDRVTLTKHFAEQLRSQAGELVCVGNAEMVDLLADVADRLDLMKDAIAIDSLGSELLARSMRLIEVTDDVLKHARAAETIH